MSDRYEVSALVSGGKDSIFSAHLAESQGWPVSELVVLRPEDPDSLLFHTPNLDLVHLQSKAWGKPVRTVWVRGSGEEAEMLALAEAVSGSYPVVSAGAIASSFQWSRLLKVAHRLERTVFVPLWGKDPERVVRAEIEAGLDIRLVHLAAEPLTPELIGRTLTAELLAELRRRSATFRPVHIAGEGGEFETLVVDAPFFRQRLIIDRAEVASQGGTTRLTVREAHLAPKTAG